ncbi:MAG: hypothetical protein HC840_12760 [Leptolyngbyaceae cyanobacterium RM2_2_4]|nr:hypothetical protein [Leptolyngbyaceae cyanobacterium RM2_2_4]
MEIIKNILIKAFNFAAIIIAIVFTLAMLRAVLMMLKNQSLKVNRDKASVENLHHEILLLSTSEYEALNELVHNFAHEFREFGDKVNYNDRTPEAIHDGKTKESFKQLYYRINQIKMPKRIPLDSSFYQNLDKTIDFLRRSAYSKEPVFKVFLECKFHLPIGEPLSVKLWNDEVKEKYWREKYYFFHSRKEPIVG